MLQVTSIDSNSSKDDGNISWTKKWTKQSSLTEGVLFSSKEFVKKTKEIVHKTGLSKKVLQNDEIIRSRKILLKPTWKQKIKIQEWMRITRFVYNLAHHFVKDLGYECDFFKLKTIILTKEKNPEASKYEWLFNTEENKILSRDAKDYAIQQYVCNVHSSTESLKEKQTKINENIKLEANMKKRTEKSSQTVGIPVNGGTPSIKWDKNAFSFWKKYKLGELKTTQKRELKRLSKVVGSNSSDRTCILKYYHGRYYMIVPFVTKIKEKKKNEKIIALDPGVRTFQTGFDNFGKFTEYGKGDSLKLFKNAKKCDKIQSDIDKNKNKSINEKLKKERKKLKKKRYKLKKKYQKYQNRIQGLKEAFHKSVAKDLCETNNQILISKFLVKGMIKKWERKIHSTTVRKMLHWSHFQFRQTLKHLAQKDSVQVHEVSEHYTSCTCGSCGKIDWKLGKKDHFNCKYCNFSLPRDYNGARNIFLMNVENLLEI